MTQPKLLVFDIGETLVNEERAWTGWARWLGVPTGTFFAVLGAVIAARRPPQDVFTMLRPGFDIAREREARYTAGDPDGFVRSDLYPDALAALETARRGGYRLGITGNATGPTEAFIRSLDTGAELIGSSQRWGVAKPDPAFFRRIAELSRLQPAEIVHVGDRIDNDILPALEAGLRAILIERGPWSAIQATWPEAARVPMRIRSLSELPAALS